jgi:methyl-accepting chemotaxis protein
MFQDWTFGNKLAAGFIAAGLTTLVIAFSGYQSTSRLIENEHWVSHTQQVQTNFALLLSSAKDAETGGRGFVITGSDGFLDAYRASLPALERTLADLRELTRDNANQQRRLGLIAPLIAERLEHLEETISTRRNEGLEAAVKVVTAGGGKGRMDELRRLVGEADSEAKGLLAQRTKEAEASAESAKSVILWGSLLGTIFIALVGFTISRSLTRQLSAAVRDIESSSSELQSASNQQVVGAKEQAMAVTEITTTMSELLATSRQIAESAQRVSQIASETVAGARSGESTVERGTDAITGIRRQVDLIVNHMLDLGKKSQQIGVVLDIVAELAEQTNILAINATIEAAGAGESGKRFAVVAEEIRKLADRVGGSTKEIRSLIDAVRSAVNTTVMTTETGSKAVEAGAKQFVEVAASFKQIAGLVMTTTEASREIELSTKQQATAVEQVNIAIKNVGQATKETEASSSQTLQTAAQLSTLSRELLRIVQRNEGGHRHGMGAG